MKESLDTILERHNLQATGKFLNNRAHAQLVLGHDQKLRILKTDKIERDQVRLLLAAGLDPGSSFQIPKVLYPETAEPHPQYLVLEYVEGKELKDLYSTDLDRAIAISKAICIDYQKFLHDCQVGGKLTTTLDTNKALVWTNEAFSRWSQKIIEQGLLSEEEILQIKAKLLALATPHPEQFFGLVHGNIHGEHIIINNQDQAYLLDLTVEARPGGIVYEILRVFDFILLEHPQPELALPKIIAELNALKQQYGADLVQAIWSFRCIGLLGMDILGNTQKTTESAFANRKAIALKMIKGTY